MKIQNHCNKALEDYLLSAGNNKVFVRNWDGEVVLIDSAYKDCIQPPVESSKPYIIDYHDEAGAAHCQDCDLDDICF